MKLFSILAALLMMGTGALAQYDDGRDRGDRYRDCRYDRWGRRVCDDRGRDNRYRDCRYDRWGRRICDDRGRRPGRGGDACFYEHANFQGRSFCLSRGQVVYNLDQTGFNDMISSIRTQGNARVTVFEHANFAGDRIQVYNDVYDFSRVSRGSRNSWNDMISSIEVY
jgi:hypothetical protein